MPSIPGTQIFENRPPLYDFSELLSQYLIQLLQSMQIGAPGNPYRIDVPLSPTNQMWGRLAQRYALSPAPQIMGQGAAALGQFMAPDYSSITDTLNRGFRGWEMPQPPPVDLRPSASRGGPPTPYGGGRALGGPVSGGSLGRSYTVGEHGPETLRLSPGTQGYVDPNPRSLMVPFPGGGTSGSDWNPPSWQDPDLTNPPDWGTNDPPVPVPPPVTDPPPPWGDYTLTPPPGWQPSGTPMPLWQGTPDDLVNPGDWGNAGAGRSPGFMSPAPAPRVDLGARLSALMRGIY